MSDDQWNKIRDEHYEGGVLTVENMLKMKEELENTIFVKPCEIWTHFRKVAWDDVLCDDCGTNPARYVCPKPWAVSI